MSVLNYSTNASSNTTVGGVSIAEGMPPGNVNNAMREMMADTRKWQIDVSGVTTTTGAGNAYAFASAQGVTAYTNGLRICFEADKDNTGAATFAIDALSAKAIKKYTNAGLGDVVAGEIQAGAFYDVVYEAAEDSFILLSPSLAIASQGEAEAGTDATKLMTPQRVAQAIAALTPAAPDAVPPGAVFWMAMNTPPSGYLKANGDAVSRTTYAALFAAIGTTFGAGNGSTTFNLPNLRGEFIRGWDDGRGVDSGRAFGSAQGQAIQSHTHSIPTISTISGSGTYGLRDGPQDGSVNVSSTGGNETRPRNVALLAVIKF